MSVSGIPEIQSDDNGSFDGDDKDPDFTPGIYGPKSQEEIAIS